MPIDRRDLTASVLVALAAGVPPEPEWAGQRVWTPLVVWLAVGLAAALLSIRWRIRP